MNSYYAQDSDQARRQRLAVAHMASEQALEQRWAGWTVQQVWSASMVQSLHQDLFARLAAPDRLLPDGQALAPGTFPSILHTKVAAVRQHQHLNAGARLISNIQKPPCCVYRNRHSKAT